MGRARGLLLKNRPSLEVEATSKRRDEAAVEIPARSAVFNLNPNPNPNANPNRLGASCEDEDSDSDAYEGQATRDVRGGHQQEKSPAAMFRQLRRAQNL